ncbi:hypothetical protein ScPMuIL_011422 [Solemya velum]
MRRKLEKVTKSCKKTQDEVLLKRIGNCADTEYGKKFEFSKIKSREDFIAIHPLTRYSHYEPYIERMMKGEVNILIPPSSRLSVFAVTSGTSGKSNVLPMTSKQGFNFFLQGISIVYDCILRSFPDTVMLQKDMKLFYTPKWRMSEAGIAIGPNSSSPSNSKSFLQLYTTPKAGYSVLSEPEALYIHLLFGLKDKYLGMIEANFSSLVYSAFRALVQHHEQLIEDIEKGCVNPSLDIEDEVRKELNELMTPDPVRADELKLAFKNGAIGLAKRAWPQCHLVVTADSGSFDLYARKLEASFCEGIPIYSPLYAASEGLLAINIWPTQKPSQYLLVPTSMFFEFIPIQNCEELQPKTLFLDQLEVDGIYEMVISNASGLYRYRFGDVVRVAGFHNQCPYVEFLYRQGQFLNVRAEKTSESAFYEALQTAASNWPGIKILDYCCAESVMLDTLDDELVTDYAPFYHVFLELESNGETSTLTDEQKSMIDETLCMQSYVYGSFRKKGSIRAMNVHIVKPGTFNDLRDFTIQTTTASANQYKVPRVLKRKEAVDFVVKNVVC